MPVTPDRKRIGLDILALLCGALLPVAFAPLNFYPLAFLIPAILFWTWQDVSPRRAFWRGYLFGLGMFGVGVSWVYIAISEFGFTSAPVAFILTTLFVAFLALFPAMQGWLTVRLATRVNSAMRWLVFPIVWMMFEWIRGWFMTGFPWLNLGYSQIDSFLAGYAPLLGVYGLSLFTVLTATAIWQLVLQLNRISIALAAVMFVVWLSGGWLATLNWTTPSAKPLSVAIVQANLPQLTKWDPDKILHRMLTYEELSEPYWAEHDIIVWPENALTILWQDAPPAYRQRLDEKARESGSSLIVGVPYGETDAIYHSSLLVLGNTPGVYHKRHLVPFGEYVPLGSVLRRIGGFFNLPMSGFSPGARAQAHLQAGGQLLAPSICYEDAFGEELIDFLPQATLLVNGSNNAWYGRSWAPHQHLQISRMRSLETGRQMIRSTTTGISAFIDEKGAIRSQTDQFESQVLVAKVTPFGGATPFVQMGNWPVMILVWLAFAGLILLAVITSRRVN